jgi:hypothetical protein
MKIFNDLSLPYKLMCNIGFSCYYIIKLKSLA